MTHKSLLLLLSLAIFACSKTPDSNNVDQRSPICEGAPALTYTIPCSYNISLVMPDCFALVQQSGIDTYVGKLVSDEENITIQYDIGLLAGNYVAESSPAKTVLQSVNQTFWFEKKDGKLYFTFPDAGPANFFTADDSHENEIIDLMKTLKLD